jgi:hypothetical protein
LPGVLAAGGAPLTTCQNSVVGELAGICWISPSIRPLRFVLDDHPGTLDDVAVQLGLARAVAAHGVEVHAGLDQFGVRMVA